ncbi:hypothetical protein HYH03_018822 [Edaphochlamys debaryana]|uniref:phytol kinase n=1 Tax=Edaphochlamys debaryana TaxID=47281 RepID=A0A835XL39_9CHLO|nr:hypothetical protein HYH03_018822 [Edaphochlamys debaryana]|eukprot:KAG2482239.1 hypothetical protein HYH03_018822 [Edaphochlamys debaryana]
MVTLQALEDAWRVYMRCADRLCNIYVERSLWQPPQREVRLRTDAFQDARRTLLALAKPLSYEEAWYVPTKVLNDEAAAARLQWLTGARQSGVAAWLLRTLRALLARTATASNPATTAWAVCNNADSACAASDAASTALSLCLAALCTARSVQDWAATAPHAAALLDPALLTALAQAARAMADLARHTALPGTQALVGATRSPRPTAPGCAKACARLSLAASQAFSTVMLLIDKHVEGCGRAPAGCDKTPAGRTQPLPEPVPALAEALRESGLAAAAARAILTCPGVQFMLMKGQAPRCAVAVPEALEPLNCSAPAWNFLVALSSFWQPGIALRNDPRPGAAEAAEALGEALGDHEVAELRAAMLETLWEQAGLRPGGEGELRLNEAERTALCRAYERTCQDREDLHIRIVAVTVGLWHGAYQGMLYIEGGGVLPPLLDETGVPSDLPLARRTARSAEAVCRLHRGQGMWGQYGRLDLSALPHGRLHLFFVDKGLPPFVWASASAPHWAEAVAWALVTAVEALARNLPEPDGAEVLEEPFAALLAAVAVAGALASAERVAHNLRAAWRFMGAAKDPAAASSAGREAVLTRLRCAGLGPSLDHALRLAYAAADRAAAPGAAGWEAQVACLLEPVPARVLAVVEQLGLDLLAPTSGPGGARPGPGSGPLGLGDAGGLAVTVTKRALALAGRLEAGATAEEEAETKGVPPGTVAAEDGESAAAAVPPPASIRAGPPQPSHAAALQHSVAAALPVPRPGPGAWGPLASELEALMLQAGSRLAALAGAEAAADVGGPTGLASSRLLGNCLAYLNVLRRTSEDGSPLMEARLLALQPHRLAAAACKLLCAWRDPAAATPQGAAGAASKDGDQKAPARPAPTVSWPNVMPRVSMALARMAEHSPHLASRVRSWLLPPPANSGDCEAGAVADGGDAGEARTGGAGAAELGARGCLAQAWPLAMRSRAAAAAGKEDYAAVGLALLRAAQEGSGGGESGRGGSGDGSSDGSCPSAERFRQAAATLLQWLAVRERGEQGPPTALVAHLLSPRRGEDSGLVAAKEAAEATVVAAPLPPLLAPPAAGRVLTQLLVCGAPGCGSFGSRSEAEIPLKRCGGCRAVRYCGAACQRAHWRMGHKDECGAMAAALVLRVEGGG